MNGFYFVRILYTDCDTVVRNVPYSSHSRLYQIIRSSKTKSKQRNLSFKNEKLISLKNAQNLKNCIALKRNCNLSFLYCLKTYKTLRTVRWLSKCLKIQPRPSRSRRSKEKCGSERLPRPKRRARTPSRCQLKAQVLPLAHLKGKPIY